MVEQASEMVLSVVGILLGRPDRAEAARRGVEIPRSAFFQLLVFYLLPIVAISSILRDLFMLFGLFRARTSNWMGVIIALMGSRFGLYTTFIITISDVFNNVLAGVLGLTLLLAIAGWAMSNVMLGFKHAKSASTLGSGQTYLQEIGDHVERLQRK